MVQISDERKTAKMITIKFKRKRLENFNHISDIYESRRIMNELYSKWRTSGKANIFFVIVILILVSLMIMQESFL